jgi:hypothetical protein
MPRVIVFDTNAYQHLPAGKLDELVATERRDGITAFADTWVLGELLVKLADPDNRPHARAALKKLYYHCGGPEAPRLIIDCEDQICRLLLGKSPDGYAAARASLGLLLERVVRSGDDDPLSELMGEINDLAGHFQKVETQRAELMFNGVVRAAVPTADSWDALARDAEKRTLVLGLLDRGEIFLALIRSEIRRAHEALGMAVPVPIPRAMEEVLIKAFPYPFHFECEMIRRVVERGWSVEAAGRRNAIWDAQIAFNAGQTVQGAGTVTLVTNENLFHEVAVKINQPGLERPHDYLRARGIAA